MEAWIVWTIVVVVLAFIELITNNLVTMWFVMSGIISLVLSIYVDDYVLQFAVFTLGGIVFLITTKPLLKKFLNFQKINLNTIVGRETFLIEEIKQNKTGSVKIDGKVWTAFSDSEIEKGKKVKVIDIKGVKVKVEELI